MRVRLVHRCLCAACAGYRVCADDALKLMSELVGNDKELQAKVATQKMEFRRHLLQLAFVVGVVCELGTVGAPEGPVAGGAAADSQVQIEPSRPEHLRFYVQSLAALKSEQTQAQLAQASRDSIYLAARFSANYYLAFDGGVVLACPITCAACAFFFTAPATARACVQKRVMAAAPAAAPAAAAAAAAAAVAPCCIMCTCEPPVAAGSGDAPTRAAAVAASARWRALTEVQRQRQAAQAPTFRACSGYACGINGAVHHTACSADTASMEECDGAGCLWYCPLCVIAERVPPRDSAKGRVDAANVLRRTFDARHLGVWAQEPSLPLTRAQKETSQAELLAAQCVNLQHAVVHAAGASARAAAFKADVAAVSASEGTMMVMMLDFKRALDQGCNFNVLLGSTFAVGTVGVLGICLLYYDPASTKPGRVESVTAIAWSHDSQADAAHTAAGEFQFLELLASATAANKWNGFPQALVALAKAKRITSLVSWTDNCSESFHAAQHVNLQLGTERVRGAVARFSAPHHSCPIFAPGCTMRVAFHETGHGKTDKVDGAFSVIDAAYDNVRLSFETEQAVEVWMSALIKDVHMRSVHRREVEGIDENPYIFFQIASDFRFTYNDANIGSKSDTIVGISTFSEFMSGGDAPASGLARPGASADWVRIVRKHKPVTAKTATTSSTLDDQTLALFRFVKDPLCGAWLQANWPDLAPFLYFGLKAVQGHGLMVGSKWATEDVCAQIRATIVLPVFAAFRALPNFQEQPVCLSSSLHLLSRLALKREDAQGRSRDSGRYDLVQPAAAARPLPPEAAHAPPQLSGSSSSSSSSASSSSASSSSASSISASSSSASSSSSSSSRAAASLGAAAGASGARPPRRQSAPTLTATEGAAAGKGGKRRRSDMPNTWLVNAGVLPDSVQDWLAACKATRVVTPLTGLPELGPWVVGKLFLKYLNADDMWDCKRIVAWDASACEVELAPVYEGGASSTQHLNSLLYHLGEVDAAVAPGAWLLCDMNTSAPH